MKGEGGMRGINWEFGINKYTLLYITQVTNKDPTLAQGTILNIL